MAVPFALNWYHRSVVFVDIQHEAHLPSLKRVVGYKR